MGKVDDYSEDRIELYIEALIFAAEYALSTEDIQKSLQHTFNQNFSTIYIEEQIELITLKYKDPDYAIELRGIADGYLFMTKPRYHRIIEDFLRLNEKKRMSKAALETLSIIAYKQPITKTGIESIRGVNSDYTIQKLLEKELVEIGGRQDGPGRPLLYCTTVKFLDHFGLKSKKELPKLREIEPMQNQIGHSENPSNQDG